MPKEYRFYLKILALPILCFLLGNLHIDEVSNLRDFMTGFVMAVMVVLILWLVYSLIHTLHERHTKETQSPDNSNTRL